MQDGGDANLQNDGSERKVKAMAKEPFVFLCFFFLILFYFYNIIML